MILETDCSMISSAVYPRIRSADRFHAVTVPSSFQMMIASFESRTRASTISGLNIFTGSFFSGIAVSGYGSDTSIQHTQKSVEELTHVTIRAISPVENS